MLAGDRAPSRPRATNLSKAAGGDMQAGFIGIGNMGLPMAEKLLDRGH
jgi:hypothetical protein